MSDTVVFCVHDYMLIGSLPFCNGKKVPFLRCRIKGSIVRRCNNDSHLPAFDTYAE